jgi:hypothetical protein
MEQQEFLIALSGSFDVVLKDGKSKSDDTNKPNIGLLIVDGIWRELENFSSGSVWLCLQLYSMKLIISDYKDFKLFKTDEPKPELVKTVFKELIVSK